MSDGVVITRRVRTIERTILITEAMTIAINAIVTTILTPFASRSRSIVLRRRRTYRGSEQKQPPSFWQVPVFLQLLSGRQAPTESAERRRIYNLLREVQLWYHIHIGTWWCHTCHFHYIHKCYSPLPQDRDNDECRHHHSIQPRTHTCSHSVHCKCRDQSKSSFRHRHRCLWDSQKHIQFQNNLLGKHIERCPHCSLRRCRGHCIRFSLPRSILDRSDRILRHDREVGNYIEEFHYCKYHGRCR